MSTTLFVGDLSSLCGIDDIEKLFSTCGTIVDIRLKYDELTKRQLSYGFVEFLTSAEAEKAIQKLNGYVLRGRALRISWANAKPSLTKERSISSVSSEESQPKSVGTKSSIHVVFYTAAMTGNVVTEETLRAIFLPFGNFADVIVKKANKQYVINSKGYAFVHFADTDAGVASAMAVVREMGRGLVLNGVYYECTVSRTFEDKLEAALAANQMAPHRNSPPTCVKPGTSPCGVDGAIFFPVLSRQDDFSRNVVSSPPVHYVVADEPPRQGILPYHCQHTPQQQQPQQLYLPIYSSEYCQSDYPAMSVTQMHYVPAVHYGPPPAGYPHHHSAIYMPQQHHHLMSMKQAPAYSMGPAALMPMPMPFPPQPHVNDGMMMRGGHWYHGGNPLLCHPHHNGNVENRHYLQ